MKLIAGLGNYGKEYSNTRHNIGFSILDNFLGEVKWQKSEYGFYYKDKDIIYLKPTTYMNLSGIALNYFINYYKIDLNDILVLHDDLDLELGIFKIKFDSSSGGHNGIKSIIEHLKTRKFSRVKIGISKNKNIDTSDYVLGKFTKTEIEKINFIQNDINDLINDFISKKSTDYLMNKYN